MASALKIALPVNEHTVPGPREPPGRLGSHLDGSAPTWAGAEAGGSRGRAPRWSPEVTTRLATPSQLSTYCDVLFYMGRLGRLWGSPQLLSSWSIWATGHRPVTQHSDEGELKLKEMEFKVSIGCITAHCQKEDRAGL